MAAKKRPNRYTLEDILAWADAYHARTGQWPNTLSGRVRESPFRTWKSVNIALRRATFGLPAGGSLAKLFWEHRGVRSPTRPPPLTLEQILAWADTHYQRHTEWPSRRSGQIAESRGETWGAVSAALRSGIRGLPVGFSLERLLADNRGRSYQRDLPRLTEAQIIGWAEAHFRRTGLWPDTRSGRVVDAPRGTWQGLHVCLCEGLCGLPGGNTLARLLRWHRNRLMKR